MDETSALDTELNTATDSVNDETAATSTNMLDPTTTQSTHKADSSKKHTHPQQPNPIKAQLSRFGQYIKATAAPHPGLQIRSAPDFGSSGAP